MRITIGTRIFLALTLVSLTTLTIYALVTRWNFERGFLEYIEEQEAETIREAAADLSVAFRSYGNWDAFRDNPRRLNDAIAPEGRQPGPRGRPPPPRGAGPPPDDPLGFGRRVALLDADGAVIAGPPLQRASSRAVPIVVDEQIVGFVAIAPRRELTDQLDQAFAAKQQRSILLMAVVALTFAAVISAVLARQLTRPVRALVAGAQSISAGHYDSRIDISRHDELGDLVGAFNQLAATLAKNRQSRQQWVADIAHELRTPLAILRGELDAIEDGVRRFDGSTRRSLQAEVERLGKIVDDLHELSVHDEGAMDYQRDRTDIAAVLNAALDNAAPRLRDAGISSSRDLPDTVGYIYADRERLNQVFANLIGNTIRYTDSPGTLEVSLRAMTDHVDISFADSAPGVPGRSLDQLFERLYRVDESRSRASGGSGLGLSICKAIVEAHDGSIEASHSDAGGLHIRIRLPLAADSRS